MLLFSATWADVVITNPGFETPVFENNSHNYKDISETGWTHTGRSGIDRGNVFGGSAPNCAPSEGYQMAFLQGDDGYHYGVTSLGQDISGFTVGGSYTLNFDAMAINGFSGVNPFYVSIDGNDLLGLVTPAITYQNYVASFTATAETMNLLFYDQGNVASGKVSWIDDIQIVPTEVNLVTNGGFEAPAYTSPHHDYVGGIDGSNWTATGRAGIDLGNPYGTTVTNCSPAEGSQMGFLQGDSGYSSGITSLAQEVSGFVVGETYSLSFEAKAIDGFSGVNPFYALVGGMDLFGLITPDSTGYQAYVSEPFVATSETMTLMFRDEGNVAAGQVTWIDSVRIAPTTVPEPAVVSLLLMGMATIFVGVLRRRHQMK